MTHQQVWVDIHWMLARPFFYTSKLALPLTPQTVKFRILVYSPQLYENYRLQSGEGLSVLFFLAWIVGDLCNLMGATLGGLVPAVILLALYVNFHPSHAN